MITYNHCHCFILNIALIDYIIVPFTPTVYAFVSVIPQYVCGWEGDCKPCQAKINNWRWQPTIPNGDGHGHVYVTTAAANDRFTSCWRSTAGWWFPLSQQTHDTSVQPSHACLTWAQPHFWGMLARGSEIHLKQKTWCVEKSIMQCCIIQSCSNQYCFPVHAHLHVWAHPCILDKFAKSPRDPKDRRYKENGTVVLLHSEGL